MLMILLRLVASGTSSMAAARTSSPTCSCVLLLRLCWVLGMYDFVFWFGFGFGFGFSLGLGWTVGVIVV